MKKILLTIAGISAVIFFLIIVALNHPTSNNRPYLTIITDSAVNNYKGVKFFENDRTLANRIQINLVEIKNAENVKPSINSFYWTRPIDKAYVVQSAQTDLKLINLQTKELEMYSYPAPPADVVDYLWIGKNLLIHYFSTTNGSVAGQINIDTPRVDHYCFFNPESGEFTPIMVDNETSKYTTHGYGVNFLKKTDSGKIFAVAYCTKTDFFQERGCIKHGFSISDGSTIHKLFDLDVNYEWGWSNNNFFVKQGGKVYLVDINKLTENTVQSSDQNVIWKTYRNEKYGFEFRHPANRTPYVAFDSKLNTLNPADSQSNFVLIAENESHIFCCEPSTLAISGIEANSEQLSLPNVEQTTFNGFPAVEIIGEGNLSSIYKKIIINKDGQIITITQNAKSDFLNNILSTFKFIE